MSEKTIVATTQAEPGSSIDDKFKRKTIKQEVGKNVKLVMGKQLFSNPAHAVNELITNSYDANATRVMLQYAPGGPFIIEDDGDGMDEEKGLPAFYRLGDSIKLKNPQTDTGRRVQGNAGFAKSSLANLALGYELITSPRSERKEHHVSEVFVRNVIEVLLEKKPEIKAIKSEDKRKKKIMRIQEKIVSGVSPHKIPLLAGYKTIDEIEDKYGPLQEIFNNGEWKESIDYHSETPEKDWHGTKIILNPLGFEKKGIKLDVSELEKRIIKEFAGLFSDDPKNPFLVYVNGKKLERPVEKGIIEYVDETVLPECGEVRAEFGYSPNNTLEFLRGIYPVVNGRIIGSGKSFIDACKIKYTFENRLVGKIHADSLKECIRLDRENVSFNHPKFKELRDYTKKLIRIIKKDAEAMEKLDRAKKVKNVIASVSNRISNHFKKTDLSKKLGLNINNLSERGTKKKFAIKIRITGESQAGPVASFEPEKKTVYINKNLKIMHDTTLRKLEQFLFDKTVNAIGISLMEKIKPSLIKDFNNFDHTVASIYSDIIKRGQSLNELVEKMEDFKPYKKETAIPIKYIRLYTEKDLHKILGRPQVVINRLKEYSILKNKEKYPGTEVKKVADMLFGFKTIEEIVRDYVEIKHALSIKNAEDKLKDEIEKRGPLDYMKEIGSDKPFWLVPNERAEEFFDNYMGLKKPKHDKKQDNIYGIITVCKEIRKKTDYDFQAGQLREILNNPKENWAYMVEQGIRRGLPEEAFNTLISKLNDSGFRKRYNISKHK